MRESKPQFNTNNSSDWSFAIVSCKWNNQFNDEMKDSAILALKSCGISDKNISVFECPGAFELPIMSLKLAHSKKFDAIICFGTIIRGDTYHFEVVANESARGMMDVSLMTSVPVFNGVLTCNNIEQAKIRASKNHENKGEEVALSAIAFLNESKKFPNSSN